MAREYLEGRENCLMEVIFQHVNGENEKNLEHQDFFFLGVAWDWVHLVRWSVIGLLYQPWMMSVEQSVEWEFAGQTEVLGENLHQRHFVHNKSHMTWAGIEPGPPACEAGN
jgi:hypothetical protein